MHVTKSGFLPLWSIYKNSHLVEAIFSSFSVTHVNFFCQSKSQEKKAATLLLQCGSSLASSVSSDGL